MEAVINSVDDELALTLQYKLQQAAGYITDRRDVSFFASGSDVYTPVGGTRVVRVNLKGDNWLIPQTVSLLFTLNKKSGGAVRVIGNPWSFFQRARVMCGGQVVEYFT